MGWPCIQSPEKHHESWVLNEVGRATVLTTYVLRKCLQDHHLSNRFYTVIKLHHQQALQSNNWRPSDLIVYWYCLFARSSALISSTSLTRKQAFNFKKNVILARKSYQHLVSALVEAKKTIHEKSAKKKVEKDARKVTAGT